MGARRKVRTLRAAKLRTWNLAGHGSCHGNSALRTVGEKLERKAAIGGAHYTTITRWPDFFHGLPGAALRRCGDMVDGAANGESSWCRLPMR